jgi:hypothetical protein
MTSKSKSWRDVLPVHPAADLFPMMSQDELLALGEDIKKHGLREGVALLDGKLLDGRNRLDAMEMAGFKLVTGNGQPEWANIPYRNVQGVDPESFVVSKNIHRRHLSPEQKRELIEKLVKASPEKSDRQIAEAVKASPSTVGKVRQGLEKSGDVSKLDTRTDRKGRKQQAHKSTKKDPDPAIAEAVERAVARSEESRRTQALIGACTDAACAAQVSKTHAALRYSNSIAKVIEDEAERLSGDERTIFLVRLRVLIERLLDGTSTAYFTEPGFVDQKRGVA